MKRFAWGAVAAIAAIGACARAPDAPVAEVTAGDASPSASARVPSASPSASALVPSASASASAPVASAFASASAIPPDPEPVPEPPVPADLAKMCASTATEPCFRESYCRTLATRLDRRALLRAAPCMRAAKMGGSTCIPGQADDCIVAALAATPGDAKAGGASCDALERACPDVQTPPAWRRECPRLFGALTPHGRRVAVSCIGCGSLAARDMLGHCLLR